MLDPVNRMTVSFVCKGTVALVEHAVEVGYTGHGISLSVSKILFVNIIFLYFDKLDLR